MKATGSEAADGISDSRQPWQLKMFSKTLKKRQKLSVLLDQIGRVQDKECLLITCGDNNGALNWYFRQNGGRWSWADAEHESIIRISELLGEPVARFRKESPSLDFPDDHFDVVVTIDVHEHLPDPAALNRELERIVAPGGIVVVTTPSGDESKLVTRIKKWVGMRPEVYGHRVVGFTISDLKGQLRGVGLEPYAQDSYAHFFTELIELAINFAYVKILSKGGEGDENEGQIAPQSHDQLKSVGKSYRVYSLMYPLVWAISQLDNLIAFTDGYAVVVTARK